MKDFPPVKDAKLTPSVISKLKSYFKVTMFSEGEATISVSKTGGVHYTGVRQSTKCVNFEVMRNHVYFMVTLIEYPKGVIIHIHVFLPHLSKMSGESDPRAVKLYSEVKNILQP